jgi:hypothetical protein
MIDGSFGHGASAKTPVPYRRACGRAQQAQRAQRACAFISSGSLAFVSALHDDEADDDDVQGSG